MDKLPFDGSIKNSLVILYNRTELVLILSISVVIYVLIDKIVRGSINFFVGFLLFLSVVLFILLVASKVHNKPTRYSLITKRIFDIAFSLFSAMIFLCINPFIIFLLFLDIGSPVYFKSPRIGYKGKIIHLYKLRTFKLDKNGENPQITKLGKFLRRTSLDYLPNFLNVLMGDLSLVGPIPLKPCEIDAYGPDNYEIYKRMKPGLVDASVLDVDCPHYSYEKRAEWDNYYFNHWSIWFDIKILFKTIIFVIRKQGRV